MLEVFLYVTYTATDSKSLLWCWVVTLDIGFVFGTFALGSARTWLGKIIATGLLSFHVVSLLALIWIGLMLKAMSVLH